MRKRDLWIIFGAVAAAILLGVTQFWGGVAETAAWGLSFPVEGQPPKTPPEAALFKGCDAAYMGSGKEKVLYLTFDAGYENGCTEKILDVLKQHNVKAAFFLVGSYMQRNADLVRRMVAEGHIVGNHTMHHPDMSKLCDKAAFAKELQDAETLFRETTGKELPKFYRPPQGVFSEENLKMAQQLGYKTVFWSLAYADWNNDSQPTAQQAFNKLLPRTHNGAVVLLHSTSKTNAQILDELLTKWEAAGYRFETIDKLF